MRWLRSVCLALFTSGCCAGASAPPPTPPEEDEPEWVPVSPLPPPPPPFTGPAIGPDGLPTALARAHVVAQMNELCPDSFCEGDFQWVFDSLECHASACTLGFHARYFAERSPVLVDHVEIVGWTSVVEVRHGSLEISESFGQSTSDALGRWEAARP